MYSLGDDVFVYAVEWKAQISVHIRKFKSFGDIYYPSATGVTIPSNSFFSLMKDGFDKVQHTMDYWIEDETFNEDIKFHIACSSPEKTVTLTKEVMGRRGVRYETSISLCCDQWTQFLHICDCVAINIVSLMFEDVDLVSRFQTLAPTSILESDTYYNGQLLYHFRAALIGVFFDCGMLGYSEETENTIGMFNEACLKLNLLNVLQEFFFKISNMTLPCGRSLSSCVTNTFLDELDLVRLINDVRIEMCCLEQFM